MSALSGRSSAERGWRQTEAKPEDARSFTCKGETGWRLAGGTWEAVGSISRCSPSLVRTGSRPVPVPGCPGLLRTVPARREEAARGARKGFHLAVTRERRRLGNVGPRAGRSQPPGTEKAKQVVLYLRRRFDGLTAAVNGEAQRWSLRAL